MKSLTLASSIGLFATAMCLNAALNVPGADGSDGALNITQNTVIDLSQAVTAQWDTSNAANAGKGVYDPQKWAVVFKYSSVNVAAGATLTFKNNGSRAPVVWLVNGDVTIAGVVSLDGQSFQAAPNLAEPGPGGFRGGTGQFASGVDRSSGFGPGGGQLGDNEGYGGGFGSAPAGGTVHGNPSLLPLFGGSGGSGDTRHDRTNGGGAGGGALLIAATGRCQLIGTIRANGGLGSQGPADSYTGGGSGGAVKIIANELAGAGVLSCVGGGGHRGGGVGRIRLERVATSATFQLSPDPSIVPLPDGSAAQLWMPADGPVVRVVSVGGVSSPEDPKSSFNTDGADITLPQVSTTPVVVETTNVVDASTVTVRVTRRANGGYTETSATVTQVISDTPKVIRWTANVPVISGFSAVQVRVVRP